MSRLPGTHPHAEAALRRGRHMIVISSAVINACAGIGRPSLPSRWAIHVAVERDHSTRF
jgi:hypothetical protein